jgi:UrcA family protein
MTRKILALSALCLAALALPAAAQSHAVRPGFSFDPTQVVSYTSVPYADLDLASDAGARAMLARIQAAAGAVCGGAANKTSKAEKADYRDCHAIAVAGAVSKMRSPLLSRLAAGPADRRAAN